MEISETQLQKFISLHKQETGKQLTLAEAQSKGLSLLRFLALSVISVDVVGKSGRIEKPDLSKEYCITQTQ